MTVIIDLANFAVPFVEKQFNEETKKSQTTLISMYRSEKGQETYPTNPVMRIKSQRKNTPMQSSMDSGLFLVSSDTPTCSPPLS